MTLLAFWILLLIFEVAAYYLNKSSEPEAPKVPGIVVTVLHIFFVVISVALLLNYLGITFAPNLR